KPVMFFFFQAEDGIRDFHVTGVQTCALPISIRAITEETSSSIDIDDDGTVKIYADNGENLKAAILRVEEITAEAEIGAVYEGTVVRIVDFGAFVNFLPGKDGLVHISQIVDERVNSVSEYLKEGQVVKVRCLDVDQRGRIELSIKEAMLDEGGAPTADSEQPAE